MQLRFHLQEITTAPKSNTRNLDVPGNSTSSDWAKDSNNTNIRVSRTQIKRMNQKKGKQVKYIYTHQGRSLLCCSTLTGLLSHWETKKNRAVNSVPLLRSIQARVESIIIEPRFLCDDNQMEKEEKSNNKNKKYCHINLACFDSDS